MVYAGKEEGDATFFILTVVLGEEPAMTTNLGGMGIHSTCLDAFDRRFVVLGCGLV